MSSRAKTYPLFLALLCAQFSPAPAQEAAMFPSEPVNMKTLQAQDRAEQAFEQGDYESAYFIYRNELVPIGDKYSQYMVGFMLLTGTGVQENRVEASSWYRLAAERGTPEFTTVRDQLMATLTPEQVRQSDHQFLGLRKKYGDLALMMQAVRRDYKTLRARTGSKLSGDSTPMTIISSTAMSGDNFYGRLEDRMRSRLQYIVAKTKVEVHELDPETVNIDLIEASVNEHLDSLP